MITPEQLAKSGSEYGEQAALFCWCNINKEKYPDLKWLFAIPNGGLRDRITAGRLKATGVKSGVPDIMLPIRRGSFGGLWIELKKPGKHRIEENQLEWIAFLIGQGYCACVCVGWIAAKDKIVNYLNYKSRFEIVEESKWR